MVPTAAHCSVPMLERLSDDADPLWKAVATTPFTSLRCWDVAVSGAMCLKLRARPTNRYLYHYSYPRLSISAAATYLVDRHAA